MPAHDSAAAAILTAPLARRLPGRVPAPVLPDPALPLLPVWPTAHRELRASRRLRLVFDLLAQALVDWGDAGHSPLDRR